MLYICSDIFLIFLQFLRFFQDPFNKFMADKTQLHVKARFTNDIEKPRLALQHDHSLISLGMELESDFTSLEDVHRGVLHTFHLENLLLFRNLSSRIYYYTDIKYAKQSKDLCSLDLSLYYFHFPHGFVFVEPNKTFEILLLVLQTETPHILSQISIQAQKTSHYLHRA